MEDIRLIVGLGNPGREYQETRHNAGFWWVDSIAGAKKAHWSKETKFHGWTTRVDEGGHEFWLLKPNTYMNESGRSVAAVMRFYKIEAGQMLVVHDELDLPPGTVKLKKGGGAGGHNGLTDIIEALDTKEFWRLRIGIGHPGHKDLVADYVLHEARREEQELIEPAFRRSLELLPRIATGRMTDAMTWLHTKAVVPVDGVTPAPDKSVRGQVPSGAQPKPEGESK